MLQMHSNLLALRYFCDGSCSLFFKFIVVSNRFCSVCHLQSLSAIKLSAIHLHVRCTFLTTQSKALINSYLLPLANKQRNPKHYSAKVVQLKKKNTTVDI